MTNLKHILGLIAFLAIGNLTFAQVQIGSIKGKILDRDSSEIIGAYVWVESNGNKIATVTDYNGKFHLSGIDAGYYDLIISYTGDTNNIAINLKPDQVYMINNYVFRRLTDEVEVLKVINPIKIEAGEELKTTLSMEDLEHHTNLRDLSSLVSSMSSDIKKSSDGELYFRGARKGDMLYLIDGVKQTNFNSVPGVAIRSMTVYTGGLPAKYGDTCGGVVVMETKSYSDLYRAWRMAERRKKK